MTPEEREAIHWVKGIIRGRRCSIENCNKLISIIRIIERLTGTNILTSKDWPNDSL